MSNWWAVSSILQWIVIFVLIAMNAVLFRQLGIMVMGSARGVESSGIPIGKKPPQDHLATADGGTWSPAHWLGSPYMMFFAGTYCTECAELMPVLKELQDEGLRIIVMLFNNGADDVRRYLQKHEIPGIVVPTDQELGHRYDAVAVPFVYVVNERGAVTMKGLAGNRPRLAEYGRGCGVTIPDLDQSALRNADS